MKKLIENTKGMHTFLALGGIFLVLAVIFSVLGVFNMWAILFTVLGVIAIAWFFLKNPYIIAVIIVILLIAFLLFKFII